MNNFKVLGLMSGTSMDGLDCGYFDISLSNDYNLEWECLDFKTYSYNNYIKEIILNAFNQNFSDVQKANNELGQLFAEYSDDFIYGRYVDLISTHGQTIWHLDKVGTKQVGNPQKLHNLFKVPIVYNVRQKDISSGGNGAPLMPFLDWLIFKNYNKIIITLNLGGIANISLITESGNRNEVKGFDVGPGMSLIDGVCKRFFDKTMDKDGLLSSKGKINKIMLDNLMLDDFINSIPPKSTGKNEFGDVFLNNLLKKYSDVNCYDLLRTLCAFSAKSIALNLQKYINFNTKKIYLIISGGGVQHPVLVNDIKKYCHEYKVEISDQFGIDPHMKESLLMSVLGVARYKNLYSNMPSVTGSNKMVVLGDMIKK